MGKRSRTRDREPLDASVEERIATAEKEYRGIKRTMTMGLVLVAGLIVILILNRPGGWLPGVVVLAAIEGISYFFLRSSLERRRDERLARIKRGEDA